MELTISEKKENLLLERMEVKGKLHFAGPTPANQKVAEAVAKELKKDASLVVIKKISTLFSRQEADFQAVAYARPEARQRFEKATKHLRKKAEEAGKKAAEEKKEEKKEGEA